MIANLDAVFELIGIGAGVGAILVLLASIGRASAKKNNADGPTWQGFYKTDGSPPTTKTTP